MAAAPSSPTPADAHLARAEEAYERREYDRAREAFEKARELFDKSQAWEGYVRALNGLGASSLRQGDHKTAFEHLNAALATAQAKLGPQHPLLARTYSELGGVYAMRGQPKDALELYGKALERERTVRSGSPLQVGKVLRRMADAYSSLGEDERAIVVLDQAAALQREDPQELAETHVQKGNALWGQGRYDQSIEVFEQAIAILEGLKDVRVRSLASAYLNLGNCYWSKGDADEARAYYEKALPLLKAELGEGHPYVGSAQFNLAVVHQLRLDYDAAIAAAEKALKIYVPAFGERHAQVVQTYTVLASALTGKGESDRALGVAQKALAIQLSLAEKGDRSSAVVYTTLAEAYEAKGDLARAERYHRQALTVERSIYGKRHPDVAEDLVLLGNLLLKMGDETEALRFYDQSIVANNPQEAGAKPDLHPPFDTVFSEELLLRALKGAARARARLGAKQKRPRDLEQAALVYGHASVLIDRIRAGYRAEGSKLKLAASAAETYDEAIGVELELHRLTGETRHLEGAFRYAEKSKAGVLRDALNEAEARSFSGIPEALLEQERSLRGDLAAADQRLTEAQLDSAAEDRLAALRERQFALKREYEGLRRRFEKEYPDYYDLKYRFDTASSAEVRDRALDERTVLVEYFLGKERVFIFTITRKDMEVTSVPREAWLESELVELREAIARRDLDTYARSAHRLYRLLLRPAESRLAGRDLLVVPDGPLSTIPFEALLEREASPVGHAHRLPYLLRDHAVSYAYSATVLLQGLRQKRVRARHEFVAFAPVFAEGATRSADAPAPLPASRDEVADVRELFVTRQGFPGSWFVPRSRVYLGRNATEGRLKAADLERYRYVHLATHGIVDEEHPGRSRLLLVSEAGSAEDGVLHLGEIYNLRLNADLVVLSACDTGRGRLARGEGIIGLTRGFLYAGAQSLVVSLWPVGDAAASDLVVDFYRELLAGRPKAQALREAKLRAMARNPEYAKPYYWSSLVLIGQPQ